MKARNDIDGMAAGMDAVCFTPRLDPAPQVREIIDLLADAALAFAAGEHRRYRNKLKAATTKMNLLQAAAINDAARDRLPSKR